MSKLTQKDEQGNWCLKGLEWEQLHVGQVITPLMYEKLYGALWKLMEYEATGVEPGEVEDLQDFDMSNAKKYLCELARHRWVPVAERLPEPNRRVLKYRPCMENGETGPISVQWGWAYKDASHWIPVPDAPEN